MSLYAAGILSLVVLLLLLYFSRNYLLSFFAFLVIVLSISAGSLPDGVEVFFSHELYGQMLDPAKAAMLGFIALYCGYVGSMEYGGPIKGFTRFVAERGMERLPQGATEESARVLPGEAARGSSQMSSQALRRWQTAVQWRAWLASVGAFFSDLGSPGIVGTLFREKYTGAGMSRERLGLLINLTAVPVCSMIPLVGWGLFAIGILNNFIHTTGMDAQAIPMFFHSIPFFCLSFLAIMTPLFMMRPWGLCGGVRDCEKALRCDAVQYQKDRKQYEVHIDLTEEEGKGFTLALSLAVMFAVLFLFLHRAGQSLLTAEVFPFMIALSAAFAAASLAAMVLVWIRGERSFMRSFSLYTSMFKRTLSVTGIMVMSWAFFHVAWKTGIYQKITAWLSLWCPIVLILPLVFLLAVVLSSLTGSAWGTYAVIIPLGILLCQEMNLEIFAGIGAAVSGSVYGDISASNSHAMHYSAESAGIDPAGFGQIQKPYMLRMGAACMVAYGLGAIADKWYVYMAIAVVTYSLLLLISDRRGEKRSGSEEWRK